jgi:hypothetical protein
MSDKYYCKECCKVISTSNKRRHNKVRCFPRITKGSLLQSDIAYWYWKERGVTI